MKTLSLASSVLIGVTLVTGADALDVDPQIPAYKPVQIGSAEIKSVGSDTMGDLMRNWAAQFTKLNPAVKIEAESKGSSTAPAALIDGASQLGRDVTPDAKRRVRALREKIWLPSGFFSSRARCTRGLCKQGITQSSA